MMYYVGIIFKTMAIFLSSIKRNQSEQAIFHLGNSLVFTAVKYCMYLY